MASSPTECAGGTDKYIRRFSPDDDELYFDLVNDPDEQENVIAEHTERVRQLRARGEEAMSPNPFRYVVDISGRGPWALRLDARGWIEDVEAEGFGSDERWRAGGTVDGSSSRHDPARRPHAR